jgi:hypothetical protein
MASRAVGASGEIVRKEGAMESVDGDYVMLTLVCVACRTVLAIRVPRERGVPAGRHLWECLECQVKGTSAAGARWPWKKLPLRNCETEPSDRDEK